MCGTTAPFPDSVEDVPMDSGIDKRSRESPDSTLKPEGKLLKMSESTPATADTDTVEVSMTEGTKSSKETKRPMTIPEAKSLMWEVHHRMPAWKAEKLIESHKSDQVDLAALGEATGILFESQEMLNEAVQYLKKIRKEKEGREGADLGVPKTSDPHSSQSKDQETSEEKGSDDLKEQKETTSAPTEKASVALNVTGSCLVAVMALGTMTQVHLLSNQQPTTSSEMPMHPAPIQSLRKSRFLCQNLMRTGSVVSLMKDRKCCGTQGPQQDVLHS